MIATSIDTETKRALLFAGQGSQYVGMTSELISTYPRCSELSEMANALLGFDLCSIMIDGPVELLRETRYTQPALFLHEAMLVDLLSGKLDFQGVAGHSLGEYSALFCAGVLSFQDALSVVKLRGELMWNAGQNQPGTMFAIVGLPDSKVEELCSELNHGGNETIVPANFNATGQVVVSGSADYLRTVAPAFKSAGAKLVTEIQVSGAFHSPLMESARKELEEKLLSVEFADSKMDVYCNVNGTAERSGNLLRRNLVEQLTKPVRWTQTLHQMKTDGLSMFMEIGPGKVLQGLVKRTLSEVFIEGCDTREDVENVLSSNKEKRMS